MAKRKAWMRRSKKGPFLRGAAAVAAIVGALLFSTAAAAPYAAEEIASRRPPAAIGAFSVNGAPVAVIAYGKRAAIVDSQTAARVKESEHMARAMPGYPQEAQINLGVRVPF